MQSLKALTCECKETVAACAQAWPSVQRGALYRGDQCVLGGETKVGKAILRDLVNATVGFEELASTLNKPSKSLHRMLAPHGNPSTENFFGIVNALQKKARVKLRVTAKAS